MSLAKRLFSRISITDFRGKFRVSKSLYACNGRKRLELLHALRLASPLADLCDVKIQQQHDNNKTHLFSVNWMVQ